MKKKFTPAIFLLPLFLFNAVSSLSQEAPKISPSVLLQYFKDNDENKILKTTLTFSRDRMENPLKGLKVIIFSGAEKKSKLAELITDDKGVATYHLEHKSDFLPDKKGLWPFSAEFEGNDTIGSANSEILIHDVTLNMSLKDVDSVRSIQVSAQKNNNGNMVPVAGETVNLYVPRMFSLLPIGEAILDSSGFASVEFPSTLPGDKEGNITIIARFEEHPEFGNVEKRSTLKWGLPSTYSVPPGHRALWTKTAPKWMIYTLSILLSGVWGHYLFAIISLIRIRVAAKKLITEKKEQFIK